MLMHDKKKAIGMIMGKMSPDGKDLPMDEGPNEELSVLAGHVRSALESKDDGALADALTTFYQACDKD